MEQDRTKINKQALLEALEKSLGIITSACKSTGISRETCYRWMREDKVFEEKVKDIENIALDFAESKLFENVRDKKEASIMFYLKTKGKKRGYIERTEQSINIEQPLFPEE